MVSVLGLTASLLHMFNHALAKGTLFLAVMCLASRVADLNLSQLSGAARRMPWTFGALVLGGLSLIGVPGTAGFISKWYLVSAALGEGMLGILLIAVIVIGSLMAVVYIWRIVETAWFKPAAEHGGVLAEAPLPVLLVTWLTALANLWFGLAPSLPVRLSGAAAESLLQHLR
jgi:multicomponent Na+:H+ antiporter subunit D